MLSHSVIFNLGPAKVWSPAIIETYFSYDPDLCTVSFLLYLIFLKTISPGYGVQASPMLLFNHSI